MWNRALITAVIVLASSRAAGQTAGPWHGEVAPPRAQLPSVTVDAGYRGPYVPRANFPITLRATAGDFGFDGYIGFHFRVGDHQTYDPPVIARAILRPHEPWVFSTFSSWRQFGGDRGDTVNAQPTPRELTIEWRDRSMERRGMRAAGTPPWQLTTVPLRVVHDSAAVQAAALGRSAHVEMAGALSDRAQWYKGFSALAAPLEVWLDLPRRVREAILGSATPIVVFGLPRSDQKFDDLDRAVVPVTFAAAPAQYRRPWPYEQGLTTTPMSWAARADARAIGTGPLPYIVATPAATWVADEGGMARPLPATIIVPTGATEAATKPRRAWPTPAQIARLYPAPSLIITMVALSLAGWVLSRRHPRAGVAAALAVAAIFIIAARDRFRPAAGIYGLDFSQPVGPGILDSVHAENVYGPSPLPEERLDAESSRTSVTEATNQWDDVEVRRPDTPMAMGFIVGRRDWRRISRSSVRRELGAAPVVRIRSREGDKIVIEYESPFAVDSVAAQWRCGNAVCSGGTAVRRAMRGTATIRNGHDLFPEEERFVWNTTAPFASHVPAKTVVQLSQKKRMHARVARWFESLNPAELRSFRISDRENLEAGSASFSFALPAGVAPASTAIVDIPQKLAGQNVTLNTAHGSTPLVRAAHGSVAFVNSYPVPPDALRDALAAGGIVEVTVKFDAAPGVWRTPVAVASIELLEKKP